MLHASSEYAVGVDLGGTNLKVALVERAEVQPSEVTGLVVSGQMMGAVLLDGDGRPVRPAIIWADTRAAAQERELEMTIAEIDGVESVRVHLAKAERSVFVRDDGAALNIGVRDRGDGMAEGLWADAGKRFAKRSGVSSTSAGLGLSIVSAVAQAHGGRLTLRRPEAGGFEVFVELPNLPDIEA